MLLPDGDLKSREVDQVSEVAWVMRSDEGYGALKDRVDRQFRARTQISAFRRPPLALESPTTDLDHPFDVEPAHHRWLLTTCVAGIAGTLIVGSAVLGIFGENAVPRDAFASVEKASLTGSYPDTANVEAEGSVFGSKELSAAYQPQPETSGSLVVPERDLNGSNNYPEITSQDLPYGDGKTIVLDAEIEAIGQEADNITTITKQVPPEPTDEEFKLAKGETLISALTDRGVSNDAAQALAKAIEPVFPSKLLKEGTRFELTLDRQLDFYGRTVTFPVELSFDPGPKETIKVEADEDGRFTAAIDGVKSGIKSKYAEFNHFRVKSKVGSTLYGAAKDNKVPGYITAELTRVFAYDVDFQRQVRANDTFEVFYGNPLTGSSSKRKVLHYAQLTLSGKTKTYYRYTTSDGQTDYYDEKGRSAQKSLLKTPVSGARLTSGFGMRRHPLLGYSKMHTGVDFGVPHGTPIRAAGSGVVKIAGRHGGYGITVELQHNKKYKTLYAHMSKLASGIRRGTKVNQGQIIGYVGSTGRSTGPHLHYEVRMNNRPINPTRINASGGTQLAGKELNRFKQLKQKVEAMMQQAPSAIQVAQAK